MEHKLNTLTSHMGLLSSVARSSNQSTTTLLFRPLNNKQLKLYSYTLPIESFLRKNVKLHLQVL